MGKATQVHSDIHRVMETYLASLFDGDVERLGSVFHPDAILVGEVNGAPYSRTLATYLEGVAGRQSPKALGESFRMRLLSLQVQGAVALAQAQVPMLGYNYHDFLSLVLHQGHWVIGAKLFTHVP